MKQKLFTFKKNVDGLWKSEINADYIFEQFTTHGIPFENTMDNIEALSFAEIMSLKLDSWNYFAKENNINLDEIRHSNLIRKDEHKITFDEIKNNI